MAICQDEAVARLRESVEQRIAKLNPGQGISRERTRHVKRWAEVHIRQVLDQAIRELCE